MLLLAGLPLLARRFFGPVSDGRIARFLRVGGYAAILALIPARSVVGPYPLTVPERSSDLRVFYRFRKQTHGMPGTSAGGPPWAGEIFLPGLDGLLPGHPPLGDLAAVVGDPGHAGRRHRRGPVFGLVMYSVAPLGLTKYATNPWLPDRGSIRSWRSRGSCCWAGGGGRGAGRQVVLPQAGPLRSSWPRAKIGQGIVAGVLANMVSALFVTVSEPGPSR